MSDTLPSDIGSALHRLTELLRQGAFEEAANYASLARRAFPVAAELIRLQGLALLQLGRRREAQTALNRAAELAPNNIELQCLLARLAVEDGKVNVALERLKAALRQSPDHLEALNSLGTVMAATGRIDLARDAFSRAAAVAPDNAGVRLNLATAELDLGNIAAAEQQISDALRLAPEFAAVHAMHAHLLFARRRPADAALALLEAARCAPENSQYLFKAGFMFNEAGDIVTAAKAFADALKRDPDSMPALGQLLFARRRMYDWFDLDPYSDRVQRNVSEGKPGVHPYAFMAENTDAAQQLQCATIFATHVERQIASSREQLAFTRVMPPADAPIRLGFIGDAFNEQPIGVQIISLIEALAKSDLDVHLFTTSPDDGSALRRRFATAATLHDVSMVEQRNIARLIHKIGIEIMIDLNGYSDRSNAELMSLRAAPVQISWLGFPGSSGANWLDYIIADAVVLPPTVREHFSEKIIYLPRCFQPRDTTVVPQRMMSRAECGLPESGTVFGCLSDTHAINTAVFARCMLILQQVSGSVLWLPAGPDGASERLRKAALALDIAPERLIFMPKLSQAERLARYAHIDLLLDTLPWNAQSVAIDALWAGCPVLTRTGDTFAGRVVTSLLHHLGLPELITEDGVSFIGMAVALGNEPDALKALRSHLLHQHDASALFDTQGFADDFRRAMRAVSARYRIGRPPVDLTLQVEPLGNLKS